MICIRKFSQVNDAVLARSPYSLHSFVNFASTHLGCRWQRWPIENSHCSVHTSRPDLLPVPLAHPPRFLPQVTHNEGSGFYLTKNCAVDLGDSFLSVSNEGSGVGGGVCDCCNKKGRKYTRFLLRIEDGDLLWLADLCRRAKQVGD